MHSTFVKDKGKEVNSEGKNFAEDMQLFWIVKSKAAMQRCRKFSAKILMVFRADKW